MEAGKNRKKRSRDFRHGPYPVHGLGRAYTEEAALRKRKVMGSG